jgi:NAD(P)-dependent dehydrogenase (short-subunit alcohol dehydrogenase family)
MSEPHVPLAGLTALVTGAAGGLGAAVARRLAADGAAVVLVDRDPDRLRQVAQSVVALGGRCAVTRADLADPAQLSPCISTALDAFGGVELLVNNAADLSEVPLARASAELWHQMLAVNLVAPAELVRLALPHLVASSGAVVNISSARALASVPGAITYEVSKAGLLGLTRSLAAELAPFGVRVNAVCPGFTPRQEPWDEGLSEAERAAHVATLSGLTPTTPVDVAAAVAMLCDPRAAAISGQTVVVDRGAGAQHPLAAAARALTA